MEWLAGFVFLLLGLVLEPVAEPRIRKLLQRTRHRFMAVTPRPVLIEQHGGTRNTVHLFPPADGWRNAAGVSYVRTGTAEALTDGSMESGAWD